MKKVLAAALAVILLLALTGCRSSEAKAADALIAKIETVTLGSLPAIEAAEAAVAALTPENKAELRNLQILTEARTAYEGLVWAETLKQEAAAVDEAIDAIGEVTLDSGEVIAAARSALDGCSPMARSYVRNADALTKAETALTKLRVAVLDEAVKAIGVVTLESAPDIEAARAVFDAADAKTQEAAKGPLADLQKAEERYIQLRVQEVMLLIGFIGEVESDSGPAITAAMEAYEALPEEAKSRVTNISLLSGAFERVAELKLEEAQSCLEAMSSYEDKANGVTYYFPSFLTYDGKTWKTEKSTVIAILTRRGDEYSVSYLVTRCCKEEDFFDINGFRCSVGDTEMTLAEGAELNVSEVGEKKRLTVAGPIPTSPGDEAYGILWRIARSESASVRYLGTSGEEEKTASANIIENERTPIAQALTVYETFMGAGEG